MKELYEYAFFYRGVILTSIHELASDKKLVLFLDKSGLVDGSRVDKASVTVGDCLTFDADPKLTVTGFINLLDSQYKHS